MRRLTLEDDYWGLVHQLMIHSWYRVGQGPAVEHGRTRWGFREGHVRDVPSLAPLWILAHNECTVMRILLWKVESATADRPSRTTNEESSSLSTAGIPGAGREGTSQDFAMP